MIVKQKITIELEPTFKIISPHCIMWLNDVEFINQKLNALIKIEEIINLDNNFLSIKIQRSGRDKFVVTNEPEQSIKIKNISINDIVINPSIGNFKTIDNLYLDDHVVNTIDLNLNGLYELRIPCLTLKGERNDKVKSIKKFNQIGLNADVVFFGASMTDWNFEKGKPPIKNKDNFADMFVKKFKNMSIFNFGLGALTNQEIIENIKYFLKYNHSNVIFLQLISVLGRQIKNTTTGEVHRWSLHSDNSKEDTFIDEFTGMTPKNILDYFVHLDIVPLLAVQIPLIRQFLDEVEKKKIKIYLISFFREEYDIYKKIFPNNVAPYFDINPNGKYCKDNNYHASPEEHEEFFKNLVNFYQNQVDKTIKVH
jgi:hypothetical protein